MLAFQPFGKPRLLVGVLFVSLLTSSGCQVLKPQAIVMQRNNLPHQLIAENEPQFEWGKRRPLIDGFGWVWGIPSKLILWNRRAENHHISFETEERLAQYLADNGLHEVKVRLNQYRPLDDWNRLVDNKSVRWPWRYTFGLVSVLGETIVPGRLFGGDHYNPYTATIHLYSDIPAIALHEGAHAKDFANRKYPGTYAALYTLTFVPLWHERTATNDVLAYVDARAAYDPVDIRLKREAYHVLFPAYGTYLGSAGGYLSPSYSTPIYLGGILVGHWNGRMRAPPP